MDVVTRRGLEAALETLIVPVVGAILAIVAVWAIFRLLRWVRQLPGLADRFAVFRRMMAVQCAVAVSFFAGMLLSLPTLGFLIGAIFGEELFQTFGMGVAAVVATVIVLSVLASAVMVGLMTMIAVAWALWDLLPPLRRD